VTTLNYAADGKTLISGDGDGAITFWDAATGDSRRKLAGIGKPVRVLAVSPDGGCAAAGTADRALYLWKLADAADKPSFTHPASTLFALHFEDNKTLISCGYDRAVRRWDAAAGKPLSSKKLTKYQSDFDFPACMVFADASLLAWGLKDNTARVWDVNAAKEKHILRGHEGAVTAIAISHDGLVIATGSRDRTIKLWDLKTGELLTTLEGHRHTVNCLAFSGDNRWLASGSSDLMVKLWDVGEAKETATLRGHTGAVQTVAFSPRDRRLASGSQDGTIKIWDIKTFE
jgi:WD40 repeat protein